MAQKNLKTFEDLHVWKYSLDFIKDIYDLTAKFPKQEVYVLTSQLRRSVISIGSNVAEGSVKKSKKDYRRFVLIAMGSAAEAKAELIISYEISYINVEIKTQFLTKLDLINKLLSGLERSLKENNV